jgi:hypothetical protein
VRTSLPSFAASLFALAVFLGACTQKAPPPEVGDAPAPGPLPCVHHRTLRGFLPSTLEGMTLAQDEGSSGRYGDTTVCEVHRRFEGRDRSMTLRIVDSTLPDAATDQLAAQAKVRALDGGDTGTFVVAQGIGSLRYDADEQEAEARLWVADRFAVSVASKGIEGSDAVREVALKLDLAGLARLR